MQGIWPISADEQATNFFMRSAEAAGYFDWGYSLGAPPAIAEFGPTHCSGSRIVLILSNFIAFMAMPFLCF